MSHLLAETRPNVRDDTPVFDRVTAAAPRIVVAVGRFSWIRRTVSRLSFIRLIRRAGGKPLWVDYGDGPEPDDVAPAAAAALADADGLLLTGGEDVDPALYGGEPASAASLDRRRDRFDLALLRAAADRGLPVFAVCRGCQLLNVSRGGTLTTFRDDRDKARRHACLRTHTVDLDADSSVATILGRVRLDAVRSTHGQAVDRPGDKLKIVGRAPDGIAEVIEDVEGRETNWVVGVQWHPEFTFFRHDEHKLIDTFIASAATSHKSPSGHAKGLSTWRRRTPFA